MFCGLFKKTRSVIKRTGLVVATLGVIAGTAHAKMIKPNIADAKIVNRDKISFVVRYTQI